MTACEGALVAFVAYLVPIAFGILLAWLLPWHPLRVPRRNERDEDTETCTRCGRPAPEHRGGSWLCLCATQTEEDEA